MKLTDTELKVLRFLPPSEYGSAARFQDIEYRVGHAALSAIYRLVMLGLAEQVVDGIYRRTPKGDEVVEK